MAPVQTSQLPEVARVFELNEIRKHGLRHSGQNLPIKVIERGYAPEHTYDYSLVSGSMLDRCDVVHT